MLIKSQKELKQERCLFHMTDVAKMAGVSIQAVMYQIGKGRLPAPSVNLHGAMRYYTEGEAKTIHTFFDRHRRERSATN